MGMAASPFPGEKQNTMSTTKTNRTFTRTLAGCAGVALALAANGCSSTGAFKGQDTGTRVNLAEKNFRIIKTGVSGESTGFSLLGFIPLKSPNYAEAKQRLYYGIGEPITGRPIGLANQTEDKSSLYLILFSIPKVTITADVVEFTDKSEAK